DGVELEGLEVETITKDFAMWIAEMDLEITNSNEMINQGLNRTNGYINYSGLVNEENKDKAHDILATIGAFNNTIAKPLEFTAIGTPIIAVTTVGVVYAAPTITSVIPSATSNYIRKAIGHA